MKKLLILLLVETLCISCLASCGIVGEIEGLTYEKYENCAVFSFDDFEGETTIEIKRTNLGEGTIYYQSTLAEGTLTVKYEYNGLHELAVFTADGDEPINGSGGYVEGQKIAITFEADSPVSGEIIIAFAEAMLNAVHRGEPVLHEHTFIFEIREDAHKIIYTCDCDWLEDRGFERHDDADADEYCDLCGYHVGLPHEHNYRFECDKTSHRLIFECGCNSPETSEPHIDKDNDGWCDVCGYVLKEQLFVDNIIMLSAKGVALTWSDFEQYKGVETDSGLYTVYEIDDTFQLMISGSANAEGTPLYIRLALKNDSDTFVEVRNGIAAVKAFYEANRKIQ